MNQPRRGEIWMMDWSPGRGSEQLDRRPGLIIQCDPINLQARYSNTVALAITSKFHDVPTHVEIPPTSANGLVKTSYVLAEQILTITKDRLERRLGSVSSGQLLQVEQAVRRVLALA
jgi:mRNA interferase MazF